MGRDISSALQSIIIADEATPPSSVSQLHLSDTQRHWDFCYETAKIMFGNHPYLYRNSYTRAGRTHHPRTVSICQGVKKITGA